MNDLRGGLRVNVATGVAAGHRVYDRWFLDRRNGRLEWGVDGNRVAGNRQRRVMIQRVAGAVIDALVDIRRGAQDACKIGGLAVARRHEVLECVGTRSNLSRCRLYEG